MKHNHKETINVVTLIDEFVARLNTQCVQAKVQKHYSISIQTGTNPKPDVSSKKGGQSKVFKTLKFVVADLDTNERIVLFELDYAFKNPSYVLSVPYKRNLYSEFLYNAVGIMAFNLEENIRHRRTEKVLNDQSTFDPQIAEVPVTPADAFEPIYSYEKYVTYIKSGKATYADLNSNQDTMSEELFNRQSNEFKSRFR